MHILIITDVYPGAGRYSGAWVQIQARALARQHRVSVLTPLHIRWRDVHAQPSLCARLRTIFQPMMVSDDEGVTVYRLPLWSVSGVRPFSYLATSFWHARLIDWDTVDVLHAHWAIPTGFIAAVLSRVHQKPFVVTEHAGHVEAWIARLPGRLMMHWTMKQARRVLVVSESLQHRIERAGIVVPFDVVPNPVDANLFRLPAHAPKRQQGRLRLLWISGFDPVYYRRKGGPQLMHALAQVRTQASVDVSLTIIGDGPAKDECVALGQQLGIADSCHFVGALPSEQVREWMHRSDALVLASLSESFGVVLIEAMACGLPVVATRCGGPEELVMPDTGILVEAGSAQALADGIIHLAETYTRFDPAHIAAYAHRRFHPDTIVSQLNQVYAVL
jgi:glycosyltransferase involved in cell wall biosynthesis